jgi:hypothetical protein
MKGFLHRVAAGVVQPRQTLHPLVQSIFALSPAVSSAGVDTGPELVSETRVPVPDTPVHRDAQASMARPSVNRMADSQERFQPILPAHYEHSITQDLSVSSRNVREDRNTNYAGATTARFANEKGDPSHEVSLNGAASIAGFIPIVHDFDNSVTRREKEQQPQLIEQNAAYAESAKAELSRANNRRQSSQPVAPIHTSPSPADDIQIHIGRIEVIAVPQAVQRPVTPAPRRGMSLDEYLSRRNGRSN